MPTLTTPEALGTSFSYKGNTKLGRNLADQTLEWFEKHGSEAERTAATRLLSDTIETISGGVVTREAKQKKLPPTPPAPEDDGFGLVGVTVQAPAAPMQVMPKAVVPQQKPVPAPWDADTPEWAKRLEKKTDAVLEAIAGLLGALQANTQRKTEAHGVGQGAANGGGQFVTEKIEALKNKGRLSYKVKGGRFQKFGVTVWPEVMTAHGFKESDFPVGEEVPFPGHTAIFTFKDAEEGKEPSPDKIVRFIRCDK